MNRTRPRALLTTLGAVVLTMAVLQTSIVPALDVVARQLHTSPVGVSWAVTANLLAAAAATPLIGRLADVMNKKCVLLGSLGLVLAGSVLGALTASLPLLIVARVLQGMSFSLYPVAVSILRDELPTDRLTRGIAGLSAMLGLGGALGLVLTGFLLPAGAAYQRVFWLSAAFAGVVTVAAVAAVPSRPRRGRAAVDWAGAAILAAGLAAVLLGITQRSGGAAAAGVLTLSLWWWWSRRNPAPLVSTALLAQRPVLLANGATLLVGMGLYFSFLGQTDFVETPQASGYGFGASVLAASLEFLLPGALAAAGAAFLSGRLIERFGARAVVVGGGLAGVLGFGLLAGWHTTRWEVMAAGLLTNAYISLAYGALPTLMLSHVAPDRTGVATSLNGIFRKVGGAVAAALVAALLTRGGDYPPETGFVAVFVLGALTAAGSVVLITVSARPFRGSLRRPALPGLRGPAPAGSFAAQAV